MTLEKDMQTPPDVSTPRAR